MPLLFATPAQADDATTPTVVVVTTPGGDDTSYQVPLTTTVTFDGVTYGSVYATTNSVITFGQPDGTYWDYPMTPSISLYSMDWVVYPGNHADEHLVISASDGGFQVDISARPYWLQNATDPTNINIVAAINTDGTVAISYSLTGPSYDGQTRTGVRLTNGSIVTLEEYGIVQVEQPPVLAPVPADPTPTPEPTIEPTPTPTPTIEPTPISTPTAEPTPNPTPIIEPTPTPTIEPTPTSPLAPYIPQGSTLLVEGTSLNVIAPEGQRIVSVTAWYGDPLDSTRGLDVSSNITQMASGQTSITIDSSNIYGDPAPGTVKTLIFLVNYESIPTEPTPIPTLTSTPTQTPTQTPVIIDPTPVVIPEPVITPIPIPTEEPVVVPITEPTVEPTPTTTPTQEPTPTPTQTTKPAKEPETPVIQSTPTPEPVPTPEVPAKPELPVDVKTVDPTTLSDKQVEELIVAANTILATAEQGSPAYQEALQALSVAAKADDPVLPTELASIPGAAQVLAAFNALGNIGADMAPATREEAKKEVLATVVAAGAAINATVGAATTTSSSNSTSSGSSGGSSRSSGGSSGGSEGTSSESKSGSSARRKEK